MHTLFISKLLTTISSTGACFFIIITISISCWGRNLTWNNSNISSIESCIWEESCWLITNAFILSAIKSCIIFTCCSPVSTSSNASNMSGISSIAIFSFYGFYHWVIQVYNKIPIYCISIRRFWVSDWLDILINTTSLCSSLVWCQSFILLVLLVHHILFPSCRSWLYCLIILLCIS